MRFILEITLDNDAYQDGTSELAKNLKDVIYNLEHVIYNLNSEHISASIYDLNGNKTGFYRIENDSHKDETIRYEYAICSHFLSPIINGDYTGLEDGECIALDNWLSTLPVHYHLKAKLHKHYVCNEPDSTYYSLCAITNLYGDCIDLTVHYL